MGKPNWERPLLHFSHDHPLMMTNMTEAGHECFGCKSSAAGWTYRCNSCNFDLHLSCSEIPLQIKHPFDTHPLILLARPIYEGGIFKCDACGHDGRGFPFHCNICKIDLHPTCANLPLQFNHPNHPHTLGLSFSPPYPQKVFCCDVCNQPARETWHYHCSQCFFDVHVTCINVTSQSNRNPNLFQPPPIPQSRSINPGSSLINSFLYNPSNMLTGILHRPPVPYHPGNIPNSSQIRQPSHQPSMYNRLVQSAAKSAGEYFVNVALENIAGNGNGGAAGFNNNNVVDTSTVFDFNNISVDATSGAFEYSSSGGFDNSSSGGFDNSGFQANS